MPGPCLRFTGTLESSKQIGGIRWRRRLFSAAGRIVHGGRRLRLRLTATWPWATQLTAAITRLQALAPG